MQTKPLLKCKPYHLYIWIKTDANKASPELKIGIKHTWVSIDVSKASSKNKMYM